MKILVTGATGLLGSHLLYRLASESTRSLSGVEGGNVDVIIGLRRETSNLDGVKEVFSYYGDNWEEKFNSIQWQTGDVLDPKSIEEAIKDINLIYHCAAIVSFDPSDRSKVIEANVKGTKNLVEALLKCRINAVIPTKVGTSLHQNEHSNKNTSSQHPTLIHISSTSALGDSPGNDPTFFVDETTPRNPNRTHSGYSVSKYESEKIVWNAIDKGLKATIVNPGIILGPGFWNKGSSKLFTKMQSGLKFYTKGATGYVDVRDVVDVLIKVTSTHPVPERSRRAEYRFCLVGANTYFHDFFNLVAKELSVPPPSIKAGKFLSSIAWRIDSLKSKLTGSYPLITKETAESANRISFYSSEKVKREFGFEFRSIEETVKWVCSHLS